MKKSNPNKAKVVFEENDFLYYQDHRFMRGIPAGIEFQIDSWEKSSVSLYHQQGGEYKLEVHEGTLWLSAPGYGLEPYGDGHIGISPSLVFTKAQIL